MVAFASPCGMLSCEPRSEKEFSPIAKQHVSVATAQALEFGSDASEVHRTRYRTREARAPRLLITPRSAHTHDLACAFRPPLGTSHRRSRRPTVTGTRPSFRAKLAGRGVLASPLPVGCFHSADCRQRRPTAHYRRPVSNCRWIKVGGNVRPMPRPHSSSAGSLGLPFPAS